MGGTPKIWIVYYYAWLVLGDLRDFEKHPYTETYST